jgi:hypothetical protein
MRESTKSGTSREPSGAGRDVIEVRHHHQTMVAKSGEGPQVRGSEGSVNHVGVFWTGSVKLPSLEDLGPYPATDAPALSIPSSVNSR